MSKIEQLQQQSIRIANTLEALEIRKEDLTHELEKVIAEMRVRIWI